jgi:hypothetical protein
MDSLGLAAAQELHRYRLRARRSPMPARRTEGRRNEVHSIRARARRRKRWCRSAALHGTERLDTPGPVAGALHLEHCYEGPSRRMRPTGRARRRAGGRSTPRCRNTGEVCGRSAEV